MNTTWLFHCSPSPKATMALTKLSSFTLYWFDNISLKLDFRDSTDDILYSFVLIISSVSSPSGLIRSERARSGGVVPGSWYHFDEYQTISSKTYFVLYIVDEPALIVLFELSKLVQYCSISQCQW